MVALWRNYRHDQGYRVATISLLVIGESVQLITDSYAVGFAGEGMCAYVGKNDEDTYARRQTVTRRGAECFLL